MAHVSSSGRVTGSGYGTTTRRSAWLLVVSSLVLGSCKREDRPSETETTGAPVPLPTAPPPFVSPPVLPATPDVPALVAAVRPTVVNITTEHEVRRRGVIDPFEFFFGPRERRDRGDEVQKRHALGSGFIVDGAGHVATNAHVVAGASSVRVRLSDGREVPASVKGIDERLDLAVLEIQGVKDLPFVSLGKTDELRVGEYVVAIGNPFGLGDTVTMGIVSAKGRELGAGPYDDFIQTDASINPGNSGGPLFNLRGQVVGINTAINPHAQGIGFATPVDALRDVLPQLVATGKVQRGRIGVVIQPVDAVLAKALGLSKPEGALVSEVEQGSPGAKAGLEPGDVIMSVDNTPIQQAHDLPREIARRKPGTKVAIGVRGKKGPRELTVTLDVIQEEGARSPSSHGPPSRNEKGELGFTIGDDPRLGVVVTDVEPGSPAAGALDVGDVVLEVDGTPIKTGRELAERVRAVPAGRPILLRVRRDGRTRFVALERTG